jgi:hypothetical protein
MLPCPHPSVVFRTVSEGAVLLHLENEVYFGLNAVGASIWQLLSPRCAELDDLCAQLLSQFPDVNPVELRRDVEELLQQLRESELVVAA